MRLLCSIAGAALLAVSALAQGTVNFANLGANLDAPFYLSYPTPLSTANGPWWAMLYAGAGDVPEELLSSAIVSGSPAEVGSPFPGYVLGGTRTIAGIPAGSPATLQVRVWRSDLGATWEEALTTSSPYIGRSIPITVDLGGGSVATPNMLNLVSFQIVPEPSVIALGALGIVSIFLCRRRKAQALR
jgi:hypothetical protein